jgi:hypothetical protein
MFTFAHNLQHVGVVLLLRKGMAWARRLPVSFVPGHSLIFILFRGQGVSLGVFSSLVKGKEVHKVIGAGDKRNYTNKNAPP